MDENGGCCEVGLSDCYILFFLIVYIVVERFYFRYLV